MTVYFVAPDGHGEPTLWAVSGNQHAVPVLRRSDVPKFWSDIVARMTGTTITADDATVNKIMAVWIGDDWLPLSVRYRYALAILAALTGVPREV